ncbi:MAG: MFS transporter [Actinoplanes sp.]
MTDRGARSLLTGYFLNMAGTGLWLSVRVLFLVRAADLSASEIAQGILFAGLLGTVVSVFLGRVADRLPARDITAVFLVLEGIATAAFAFVGGYASFLVVVCFAAIFDRVCTASSGAMLARSFPHSRVRIRALMQAVGNAGFGLGALAATAALVPDDPAVLQYLALLNGFTFLLAAVATLGVPRVSAGIAARPAPRWRALRDRRYVLAAALNAALSTHASLLTVALPLWVLSRTTAPVWVVSASLVANTVLVTLLQVRAARPVRSVRTAVAVFRRAGVALALSCCLFLAAEQFGRTAATVLILVGALGYTFGEMWHSAAGYGLGFDLAPDEAQGEYQAVYSAFSSVGRAFSPVVVVFAAVALPGWGWLLLGAAFVVTGYGGALLTRSPPEPAARPVLRTG